MKKQVIFVIILMFIGISTSTQVRPSQALSTPAATSVSTEKLQFTKLLHIAPIMSDGFPKVPVWVAWSPDASYLAVGYMGDTVIRLLDGATGQEKFSLQSPGFMTYFSLVWSPSGNYLAGSFKTPFDEPNGGDETKGVIRIWKISKNSAQIVSTIVRPPGLCFSAFVSWHKDENKLVDSCWSGQKQKELLRIWNVPDGTLLTERDDMYSGVWSPDGSKMIVLVLDNENNSKAQIVNGTTLRPLLEFPQQNDGFGTPPYIAWSGDSRYVAGISLNSADKKLWIWNTETGTLKDKFEQDDNLLARVSPTNFTINPAGTLVSVVLWNNVYFWNVETGKLYNHLQINDTGGDITETTVQMVSWQQTKNIIALGNGDGSIQVWKIE